MSKVFFRFVPKVRQFYALILKEKELSIQTQFSCLQLSQIVSNCSERIQLSADSDSPNRQRIRSDNLLDAVFPQTSPVTPILPLVQKDKKQHVHLQTNSLNNLFRIYRIYC
jgi:hypothetical protein